MVNLSNNNGESAVLPEAKDKNKVNQKDEFTLSFNIPIRATMKSLGARLVPFFKACAVYFVLYEETVSKNFVHIATKCVPILALLFFVVMNGVALNEHYSYSRRVMAGLVFSVIGDIFMIFKMDGYFEVAIAFFAVAHFWYASAFGWSKPFAPGILAVCTLVGGTIYSILYPNIQSATLRYAAGAYMMIIMMMVWRSLSRVQFFQDLWTWTKLCSCVGAILFATSDTLIAINLFVTPIPFANELVMSTYFLGQLGIAMSVVDSQVDSFLLKPVRYSYHW